MHATTNEIVGRDAELGTIAEHLDSSSLPRVLLLQGDAGIGKTTVWEYGVQVARARGHRVLSSSPANIEMQLAFTTLGDLLDAILDEALASVPDPQRRALEVALLQREAGTEPPDIRAIGLAFLSALRALASRSPLLLAIDDVQWLDRSSRTVLEFALRRLRDEPIRLLLAVRAEVGLPAPLDVERAFGGRVDRIRLGPLSLGAVGRVLRTELGGAFNRTTLRRLHQISAGNPLYALEVARALRSQGRELDPTQELPIPRTLRELLDQRLARLPDATSEMLLVAAAMAKPTTIAVRALLGEGAEGRIRDAVSEGIIELDGQRVRFSHPLLAAAAYSRAELSRRRSLHRRLADTTTDTEERAKHLALAADEPDAQTAELIDAAAQRAAARGAPIESAELLERARQLTPADDDEAWGRRTADAIEAYATAGDAARAEELARELLDRIPRGVSRARALIHLAWERADIVLCDEAGAHVGTDDQIRAELDYVRCVCRCVAGEYRPAVAECRRATESAAAAGQNARLAQALSLLSFVEFATCSGQPVEHIARASRLAGAAGRVRAYHSPGTILGRSLLWRDDLGTARRCLEDERRRAVADGDEESRALLCSHLTELEVRAGDMKRARAYADEIRDYFTEAGKYPEDRDMASFAVALVDAHLGRADLARAEAEQGLAHARTRGRTMWEAKLRAVLGFLELSLARFDAALVWLVPLGPQLEVMGVRDPGFVKFAPDEIEAYIKAGRLAEAGRQLDGFEARGRELDRSWVRSSAGRCRGLLLAAQGDLPAAVDALDRAVHEDEDTVPFEHARTLLALGQTLRRSKQKRSARASLERALALFDDVGAQLWSEQASAELARIGGRSRSSGDLTPTERRVAELVADGRSNKEVAAALFVSVKTVEASLSRVYSKLGVRSRVSLAHRLATKL